jgi:hypothetical protein
MVIPSSQWFGSGFGPERIDLEARRFDHAGVRLALQHRLPAPQCGEDQGASGGDDEIAPGVLHAILPRGFMALYACRETGESHLEMVGVRRNRARVAV